MKWVTVNGKHINTDQVQVFYWWNGYLHIYYNADPQLYTLPDPEKENYHKLCRGICVRPNEEDTDQ